MLVRGVSAGASACVGEEGCRLADGAAALLARVDEPRQGPPAERVGLEAFARDGLVQLAELRHGEGLLEEPGRVGSRGVIRPDARDGEVDDRVVVVVEPVGVGDGHGLEARERRRGNDGEVRDREDPASVVAVGVVEDSELDGLEVVEAGLLREGAADGVGEVLALVEERAGEASAARAVVDDERDDERAVDDGEDRAVGVILGSALADALGAPYEFQAPLGADQPVELRAGGSFGWEKGEWTDDTSMAVPILRALAAGERLDDATTLGRVVGAWKDWARDAKDVGIQTRRVLDRVEPTEASAVAAADALHAETGRSGGNGSLMRLAPVVVATLDDAERTAAAAARQSALTHHDPEAAEACVLWALAVRHAVLTGEADLRAQLGALPADRAAHWSALLDEAEAHLPVHWYGSNGWVRSSLQSAWSAVVQGTDYRSRVELAVRAGGDTDTVAAITGMLAGALAGHSRLPLTWLRHLHGWGGRGVVATGDDLARLTEIVLDGAPGTPGRWPHVERMPVSGDTTTPVAHPDDPGVLLADLSALDDLPAGVDAVVSLCRVGTAQPAPSPGVRPEHHVHVRLIDEEGTNLDAAATLREVADAIADLRAEGRTVLVHCYEARSRTAAAAAAYSVLRFGVEPEAALERAISALRLGNPRDFLRDAVRSLGAVPAR